MMSMLPSIVTTDSEPTDCPQLFAAGSRSHSSSMSGTSQQQSGRGAREKIAPDIRSVDSGYSETSHMQEVVSDAVPSMNLRRSGGSSVDHPGSTMDTVNVIHEHLVHQIHRTVGQKGKQEDSSSSSSSVPPIPSSSSSPSTSWSSGGAQDVTEEDIQELLHEMPPEMRVDFQDAMVLYCEDDRENVMEFVDHFSEIRLLGSDIPKIVLNDDIAISIGSKFKALEFGIDRCTYVFLYITKLFCVDSWSEYSSETCLMEAIHNPEKKWCVVPVFTEPKRKASFRIPPSLNSLKGIQYWTNDKFFRESVQKLLEEKLYIRKKHEKQLTRERKEWVTKYRIRKYEEKVKEREESLARQKRENDAKLAMEHKMAELERTEKEEKLKHELELSHLKTSSENENDSLSMLQKFAQKFNVSTKGRSQESHISSPDVSSTNDYMKWLRNMSNLQSFGCNPEQNAQAASPMPRSASDHIGLSARAGREGCGMRGLQETSYDPPRSSESSTGFNISAGNRKNSGSAGVSKFFSLPNRPTHVCSETSQSSSLPPEPSVGDLEEDFKSVGSGSHSQRSLDQYLVQGTLTLSQHQQSRRATSGSSRPGLVTETAPQSLEHDCFSTDSGQVDPSVLKTAKPAKEIHYHYHYYSETKNQSQVRKKDQTPLNIVGATVVQIGNDNTVKMLGGQVVEGTEEVPMDSEEEEEDPTTVRKEQERVRGQSSVSGSQPPSTIYQDNNPSVAPQHTTPLPQASRTPESPRFSHTTAAAATTPSQHVAPRNPNVQAKAHYGAAVSANVSRSGQHLPQNSSAAGSPSVTLLGSENSGFGDMPSVQRHTSTSLSSLQPHPSTRLRPVGVAALMPRGVGGKGVNGSGDSTHNNISTVNEPAVSAPQNVETPPPEHFEMAVECVESSPEENEDPITEQTLAKQRALESEVD
ncbi:uncharacterized protein [Haliotis asinina]